MLTFKDGKELKKGDLFRFEINCDLIVPVEICPLYAENYNGENFVTTLKFDERFNHEHVDIQRKIDEYPLMFEYIGNGKCKETISNQIFNILCYSEECLPMYHLDFYKMNSINDFEKGIKAVLECPLAIKIGSDYDGEDIVQVDEMFKQQNDEFKSNSDNYLENIKILIDSSGKLIKDDIQNVVKPALLKLDEMNKTLNSNSRHI